MTEHTHSEFLRDDPQSVEIGSVLTQTFELIKEHPAELIGLTFVGGLGVGVINVGVEIVSGLGHFMLQEIAVSMGGGDAAAAAVSIAMVCTGLVKLGLSTVLSSTLSAMFIIMWLRLIRGQKFSIDVLFEAKRFIVPIVLIQFATQFAVMAGMLACIVPGIIVAIGLSMSSIVAIDHGLKPLDALSASWEIANGRKLDIFIMMIALFCLNIVGMLACGAGLLVTVPMSAGSLCLFYTSIARVGDNYLAPNEPKTQNPTDQGGW